MKKLTYIIAIVILSLPTGQAGAAKDLPSIAQNSKIDSLTTRLGENLHDTDRVNTLNDLAWELQYSNPDTAIILSLEALTKAEATKWQLGIAKSNGSLGSFNWLKGDYPKALEYYFKALKINEELGGKTGIAINLGNIGIVYNEQGDSAVAASRMGRDLAMAECAVSKV